MKQKQIKQESVSEVTPAEEGYCLTIAKKAWKCNIAGHVYDFSQGDEVEIASREHYDMLTHPQIDAIERVD